MPVTESTPARDVTLAPAVPAAQRRFDWPAYGLLAAISAVGAGFAAWAYPLWDDGMWDMFYRLGSDRPAEYVGTDRPFFCWLVKWIYSVPAGLFWFETIGLSVLTTWGLGLFTLYLAKRVLPRGQAPATACLATAPLLSRAQISLVTYPLLLASMLGGFTTVYLFETALRGGRTSGEKYWRWAVGTVIFVIAGLLTEYTVAVAAAGMVWIVLVTWPEGGAASQRGRDGVGPRRPDHRGLRRLSSFCRCRGAPRRDTRSLADEEPDAAACHSVNSGAVGVSRLSGGSVARLGTISVEGYVDAGCIAVALLVAGLVVWLNRNAAPPSADDDRPRPIMIVGLVFAVAAGLTPMVLMKRWPTIGPMDSRFWRPWLRSRSAFFGRFSPISCCVGDGSAIGQSSVRFW